MSDFQQTNITELEKKKAGKITQKVKKILQLHLLLFVFQYKIDINVLIKLLVFLI